MKVVEVEWIDAQTDVEIMTIEEVKRTIRPISARSVGYLVLQDKDFIILSFTDFSDGNVAGHIVIPTEMIKKVTIVRVK